MAFTNNMSNDDVGKTEHTLHIVVPHVNNKMECSFRQYFKMHPKIERNLLVLLILVSISLDPLFFYICVINNDLNCLGLDNDLRIVVVSLRTFVDGLYITLWFHKLAFLPQELCGRILSWIVAILAILPLPQVVVYAISWRLFTVKLLKFIVLIQLVPRVYLIIPSYEYAKNRPYKSINLWAGAAFYLFMFIFATNVLGASWYLLAIERNMDCWRKACKTRGLCGVSSLYCDGNSSNNNYLEEFCQIPPVPNSTFFDHGIYLDAFQRDIISSQTNFLDKFFYCCWWGLQSLSSFGQNLKPGTYIWDIFFAIFIGVSGLILVALLIGNMQEYLRKKTTIELDRDRIMKRISFELLCWPPFYKFPQNLGEQILLCKDDKWLETTEINLEGLLKNTPPRLGEALKRHLCKDLFSKVEKFEGLDPIVKEKLRIRAKPVVFQAKTTIHKEGYPVHEMIHIVQGKVLAFNKGNGKKEGLPFHMFNLSKNDSFGKELMDKVKERMDKVKELMDKVKELMDKVKEPMDEVKEPVDEKELMDKVKELMDQVKEPMDEVKELMDEVKELMDKTLESPLRNLPLAAETVQSLTKVEAFALSYDDIVDVLNRYGYLSRSNQENWAANVITNAIRRRAAFRKVGGPSHGK